MKPEERYDRFEEFISRLERSTEEQGRRMEEGIFQLRESQHRT
jgi:hypothetical protein